MRNSNRKDNGAWGIRTSFRGRTPNEFSSVKIAFYAFIIDLSYDYPIKDFPISL